MSDYTQTTFFAPKDLLSTSNPDKIILGAEVDPEFAAISVAIATKYDSAWSGANAGILDDVQTLSDPLADRIGFWDDSAKAFTFLTASTGLTIAGTSITTNDAAIVHDNLSGFVPDEHIAHSGVILTAGTALTGGGTIAASRTFNVDINEPAIMPNTIDPVADYLLMYDSNVGTHYKVPIGDVTSSDSGFVPTSRVLTAGAGMTGGGDLSANRTFDVIAGTGITVAADSVGLDTANTRNVDHAAVTLTAGVGLSGGGNITASRTFDLDITGLTTAAPLETDELAFYDVSGTTARKATIKEVVSSVGAATSVGARKATNTDRTSTTTTTADPDLSLSLGAGTWEVDLFILVRDLSLTSNDIKFNFGGTNIGSTSYYLWNRGVGSTPAIADYTFVSSFGTEDLQDLGTGSSTYKMHFKAFINMLSAGTLDFEWAQGVSNATAVRVEATSSMNAKFIA